jgi:hypothetical protein
MRFNNRSCALMDIPDLPQGAFEHIGDRKIKPQGGGGGGDVFSPITDPISDALGTSGGGGGILGAVEDVGQAIGGGLADVDEFVNENLPGGWISPALLAAAVAAPYAAPALAAEGAGAAAFTGATETGLATLAGEAAVADTVGAALLSGAAETAAAEAVGQALPYTLAADASNLAANGFSEATIAQNLTASGVDSFVAADAANLASQGLSESAIAQNLAQAYTTAELAGSGITSTLPVATKPLLTPMQAIQGIRAGMGLLGGGQKPQMPQMPQMGGATYKPAGAVDYSGLYNLLALQRPKNPNSLLG